MAVSPPPTTAMTWLRNMGRAPSQVAQAETPFPQKVLTLGRSSRRAEAPVAMMTARASICWDEVVRRNTGPRRSTEVTSSVSISAPNRTACSRIWPISSGPMMPLGKPGKFSTSEVVINWPPGCPPAMNPSITRGFRSARLV